MSNEYLVAHLLLQLIAILLTCKFVAYLGRKFFHQTEVVCEMLAGVILGPSLLGYFAPNIQKWLFPAQHFSLANGQEVSNSSMSIIYVCGQLGLIFFMFIVGLEFDGKIIKHRIKGMGSIVFGSTFVPMLTGAVVAYVLYAKADLFYPEISLQIAMCFLGVCFAITAFPMLARILEERGITHTYVGTLALVAGSICDAFSWCLLSFLLAIVKADSAIIMYVISGGFAYILFMFLVVKKHAARIINKYADNTSPNAFLVGIIIYLFLSAFITSKIGIYPIFGAFIAGAVLPKDKLLDVIRTRIQPLTLSVLLPLFFVYSGLNTEIQLINSPALWGVVFFIVITAMLGKLVAGSVSARLIGESWYDSLMIGTLMNSRGLMELIVLNIGLYYQIITPVMFSILTIMAIVTTLITTPLLSMLDNPALLRRESV